jgi:hypothetical protein
MIAVLLALVLAVPQGAAATLPDTPQGKRIAAYLEAFNSGDEKTYLAMQDAQMQPDVLKRRSLEERAQMFKRLRGDFGTMKVTKVLKASATEVQLLIPNKEGIEATFTFSFSADKPFLISGIGVEIDRGPGN